MTWFSQKERKRSIVIKRSSEVERSAMKLSRKVALVAMVLFTYSPFALSEPPEYKYSEVTVIVYSADFFCPPCRRYESQEPSIKKNYPDVWFAHYKSDKQRSDNPTNGRGLVRAETYEGQMVSSFPTFVILRNDIEMYRIVGYNNRSRLQLQQLIQWAAFTATEEDFEP